MKKKKKSPSQVRREQRRKEERSLKKAAEATEKVAEASEFQCSQCDSSFKTEEDLNAHIGEVHTAPVLPTPEKERAPIRLLYFFLHLFLDREKKMTLIRTLCPSVIFP